MGPIGPQDGDDHGNGAHDVEDDEAGDPRLQLGDEQVMDRLRFHCFSSQLMLERRFFSYVMSSMNVSENL